MCCEKYLTLYPKAELFLQPFNKSVRTGVYMCLSSVTILMASLVCMCMGSVVIGCYREQSTGIGWLEIARVYTALHQSRYMGPLPRVSVQRITSARNSKYLWFTKDHQLLELTNTMQQKCFIEYFSR